MRRGILLAAGLCLLLCTSVRGIREGVFDRDWAEPEYFYDYYDRNNHFDHYSIQPPEYYYRDELPDPEEEKILKIEVLKALVEDIQEAARGIASEIVSDPKRRISFGKLGHTTKPIKLPSWSHKPHKPLKPPSADINLDIGAEIVVPPPVENSENEE